MTHLGGTQGPVDVTTLVAVDTTEDVVWTVVVGVAVVVAVVVGVVVAVDVDVIVVTVVAVPVTLNRADPESPKPAFV